MEYGIKSHLGMGLTPQASIENNQIYEFKRDSWLAKKALPEKVELIVTTVLHVNENSVRCAL